MLKQAILLVGGKGTRLQSILNGKPKPLVPILGTALLEIQIKNLLKFEIKDFIFLVDFGFGEIKNYVELKFPFLNVRFVKDGEFPIGTGGSLINSYSYFDEEFLIVYGDTYFDINIFEFYRFHSSKNSDLSLFTHPNDHPFDSDIVITDCNDRVINISGYPHCKDFFSANIVNAAFFICNKRVFENHKFKKSFFYDFVKDLIPVFISKNYYVFSYLSKEYIKDCGTVQRIIQVESDINNNIPRKCSLDYPKPTIFIDRDGTLINDVGHLNNFRDIVIFEDVFSNLVKLNKLGFLTCLITNQPVIARGDLSFSGLAEVHNYLEWELGKHGAYLDLIEFCPHHPDSGFEGEIPFLKIKCECRKPEIGLFKNVEAKYEIDYNNSWMIGDSTSDILAGNRFGIKTILLLKGEQGLDGKYECNPSFIADSFFSAVEIILNFKS